MNRRTRFWLLIALLLGAVVISLILTLPQAGVQAEQPATQSLITGFVHDEQRQPVERALVTLMSAPDDVSIMQATTQPDGRYTLSWPEAQASEQELSPLSQVLPPALVVHIERAHFQEVTIELDAADIQGLRAGEPVALPDTILLRRISAAFWIATLVLLVVLIFIASGALHNTLAALVGMVVLFAVSYLGQALHEDLFIFDFHDAMGYVDWNVVFLIMGMMIVIAVLEGTGIFQWLALRAYRLSRGRLWLLLVILMLITGVASAFLDNVTTMLLMTPITVQIALALGINPLALLIPEMMASNVVGVSTLIGTPTNILIGSYGDISFSAFLGNLTPGVVLAFVGLVV